MIPLDAILPLRSKGPCEVCGAVKICYDLPHGSYRRKQGIIPVRNEFVSFPQPTNMRVNIERLTHSDIILPIEYTRVEVGGNQNAIEVTGSADLVIIEGEDHVIHVRSKNTIVVILENVEGIKIIDGGTGTQTQEVKKS
jgi:hypothetical protein